MHSLSSQHHLHGQVGQLGCCDQQRIERLHPLELGNPFGGVEFACPKPQCFVFLGLGAREDYSFKPSFGGKLNRQVTQSADAEDPYS